MCSWYPLCSYPKLNTFEEHYSNSALLGTDSILLTQQVLGFDIKTDLRINLEGTCALIWHKIVSSLHFWQLISVSNTHFRLIKVIVASSQRGRSSELDSRYSVRAVTLQVREQVTFLETGPVNQQSQVKAQTTAGTCDQLPWRWKFMYSWGSENMFEEQGVAVYF